MKPTHIIIHHSLTKDGRTASWPAITRYHVQDMGWKDNGYHFGVEDIDGTVQVLVGRMQNEPGAHCSQGGMNQHSLGVCLVGNFDEAGPGEEMLAKTVQLVRSLMQVHGIPAGNVRRHSEYATYKSCPGRLFPWADFMKRLQAGAV